MALALKDRVKETTIVVGTGAATLLGSSIGFQPFSVVGNGNTTYYCISDQFGSNWEVGIGTYSSSGNTLARTTVLASSNAGALVVFTTGVKDVFVTYPAEKGVWLDASNNAIGLGTPAAFVGTNITGTASGLTAGNVTTNANLTGAITSTGNATSLGSFTSLQLATALTNETGTGSAVFSDNASLLNPTYTGTLTGSTGILNIGSGQVYKDASGKVGINVTPAAGTNAKLQITGLATNATTLATAYSDASLVVVPKSTSGFSLAIASGTGDNPQLQVSANGAASGDLLIQPYGGNVGIGTSSPAGKLTIAGSTNPNLVQSSTGGITVSSSAIDGIGGGYYGTVTNHPQMFYTNNTERMRIDSSGNLLVGTTSAISIGAVGILFNGAAKNGIDFKNSNASNTGTFQVFFNSAGAVAGSITQTGVTSVGFNGTSDQRLKENIVDAPSALNSVNSIKVRSFDWKSDGTHVDYGYIAQELLEVAPEAVYMPTDEDEMMGVDFGRLTPRLVKAIQELKAIIDTQQEQINSLLGK